MISVRHPLIESRPPATFCDVCESNKIAFGVLFKCKSCNLVIHKNCKDLIRFNCQNLQQNESQQIMKSPPEEKFDTIKRTFSNSQLASRLERYNKTVKNSFVMQLRKDYSFTGYIRVELELTRPITVLDGNEPPQVKYLPKNTVKAIYLTSQTSASQVVKALLQKFKITNDARKFMLCERIQKGRKEESHVTIRPMTELERPLFLTLLWGSAHTGHGFRLKDHQEAEPDWFDFEEHELKQFLRLYNDEKEKALNEIKEGFEVRRYQIVKILKERKEPLVSPILH